MPYVPDETVVGRVEDVVERDGDFYGPEARAQMTRVVGQTAHDEISHLGTIKRQLVEREFFQLRRAIYFIQKTINWSRHCRPILLRFTKVGKILLNFQKKQYLRL